MTYDADFGVRWDDLRFPAATMNPPGSASPPTENTTYGWLEFSVNELIFMQAQLPHAWKEGSTLKPHVHWMKSTSAAGFVKWQLDYRWCSISEAMAGSWTTLANETPAVSDGDTQYKHALTALGDISATGKQISDMLVMKLTRVASTGAAYAADAVLLEFDIHYQIDDSGSRQEYIK